MDDSELTLSIDLHYFMDNKDLHQMDATVHNECEANLIQVLNHLGDVFDEDIQIDVSALGEGGVIDKLKIKFKSSTAKEMFLVLFGALISHFIGIAPSLDESQKQLYRAEIIKKIKEGNYSDAEIKFVIQGDPEILTRKNRYFEELDKEKHVTKVTCSSYGGIDDNNRNCRSATIEKKDFSRQIVKGYTNKTQSEYRGTSVLVISPVLMKGSKAKWKGLFNNQEITFKIVDKEFLEQVYAKEVGFTTGTSLKCDLVIKTTTIYDAIGRIAKSSLESEVSNITSWDDGVHVLHETKRYRRKKIEESQLSLFCDEDFK